MSPKKFYSKAISIFFLSLATAQPWLTLPLCYCVTDEVLMFRRSHLNLHDISLQSGNTATLSTILTQQLESREREKGLSFIQRVPSNISIFYPIRYIWSIPSITLYINGAIGSLCPGKLYHSLHWVLLYNFLQATLDFPGTGTPCQCSGFQNWLFHSTFPWF